MLSESDVERFLRAYAEHWQDAEAGLGRVLHEDGTLRIAGSTRPSSREESERFVASVKRAIPDLRFEILEWAERDGVVFTEWEMSGTLGGRRLSWQGINRNRLVGDRSMEAVSHWDRLSLLENADPERPGVDLLAALAKLQA